MPGLLEFDGDCLIVLRRSLLASAPQEGCALLLGDKQPSHLSKEETLWKIKLIWPCCNIWEPGFSSLIESANGLNTYQAGQASKKNRFAIDPREQLLAQRWGRKNSLKVLGSAHSHPYGDAIPSIVDRSWSFSQGLMIIADGSGRLRGWWMRKDKNSQPLELALILNE